MIGIIEFISKSYTKLTKRKVINQIKLDNVISIDETKSNLLLQTEIKQDNDNDNDNLSVSYEAWDRYHLHSNNNILIVEGGDDGQQIVMSRKKLHHYCTNPKRRQTIIMTRQGNYFICSYCLAKVFILSYCVESHPFSIKDKDIDIEYNTTYYYIQMKQW